MNFSTTQDGKRKLSFSWGRFINNAVPNFANSGNPEFSLDETDRLFDCQIASPSPTALTPSSFYITEVVTNEKLATKVNGRLINEGLITTNQPAVHTKKIGKDLPSKFAFPPVFGHKKMVCLMFVWEEELMRYRLLNEEEEEIRTVIEEERRTGGRQGELGRRLLEIEGLKRLKPSMRTDQARESEILPAYS